MTIAAGNTLCRDQKALLDRGRDVRGALATHATDSR
jgi:hypothetical protein